MVLIKQEARRNAWLPVYCYCLLLFTVAFVLHIRQVITGVYSCSFLRLRLTATALPAAAMAAIMIASHRPIGVSSPVFTPVAGGVVVVPPPPPEGVLLPPPPVPPPGVVLRVLVMVKPVFSLPLMLTV